MLTVHHLNNSRSQRVLWLLEELQLDYEIKHYQRDAETNLAAPELLDVHPLGKSPVITDGGEALQPRITSELDNHLGYLNHSLQDSGWFVGGEFTAADVQLSFVPQVARLLYTLDPFPNLANFLERIHARPAYRAALEKGGEYAFGS